MIKTGKLWQIRSAGNRTLHPEDESFFISYQPNPNNIFGDADNMSAETAIVKDGYYILNSDFREEYEALVDKGFDACIQFFLSKPELKSSWSNDWVTDLVLDDSRVKSLPVKSAPSAPNKNGEQ